MYVYIYTYILIDVYGVRLDGLVACTHAHKHDAYICIYITVRCLQGAFKWFSDMIRETQDEMGDALQVYEYKHVYVCWCVYIYTYVCVCMP